MKVFAYLAPFLSIGSMFTVLYFHDPSIVVVMASAVTAFSYFTQDRLDIGKDIHELAPIGCAFCWSFVAIANAVFMLVPK